LREVVPVFRTGTRARNQNPGIAILVVMAHRFGGLVVAFALLFALSGCVTTAGGTVGELGRSAQDSASDTTTAQLALRLFAAGSSTVGVTGTALSDSLSNVTDTQGSVASMSVSTRSERELRSEVLRELHRAVTAIQQSQEVVDRTPGAPTAPRALSALRSASMALLKLGKQS
jgi:hypothetical protein